MSRQINIAPKRIKFKKWVCLTRWRSKIPQMKRLKKKPRRVLEKIKARVRVRERARVRKKRIKPVEITRVEL